MEQGVCYQKVGHFFFEFPLKTRLNGHSAGVCGLRGVSTLAFCA